MSSQKSEKREISDNLRSCDLMRKILILNSNLLGMPFYAMVNGSPWLEMCLFLSVGHYAQS